VQNNSATTGTVNTAKNALTPYYRMDVVPYITRIQTTNRKNGGLKEQQHPFGGRQVFGHSGHYGNSSQHIHHRKRL